MSVDIYVATHKQVNLSFPDHCKLMQVNAQVNGQWEGYLHDNDGDNISLKNASYCELTALYSLWKNSNADVKGIFHYRRYMTGLDTVQYNISRLKKHDYEIGKYCISEEQINRYLKDSDIILEYPYLPYPKDAKTDLAIYCYQKDIDTLRQILVDKYPSYVDCYDRVMNKKHLSYANMCIAKSALLNEYCEWLFDILGECEQRIDIEEYDAQHKRIFGYFSEILLNVFVEEKHLRAKYVTAADVIEYFLDTKKLNLFKVQVNTLLGKIGIKRNNIDAKRIADFLNSKN